MKVGTRTSQRTRPPSERAKVRSKQATDMEENGGTFAVIIEALPI